MMRERITLVKPAPDNAGVHNPYSREPRSPRDIIRALREQRGFRSDRQLALTAGLNQSTLSRYLAGQSATLDLGHWQALAKTLEVTISELLGEVPLHSDPQIRSVVFAMERLGPAERSALVAAANAMAQRHDAPGPADGAATTDPAARPV